MYKVMSFQKLFLFLNVVINVQASENLKIQNLNKTLFLFTHPSSCKQSEIFSLDYFMCLPCNTKSNSNLTPSLDKLTCECKPNVRIIAHYDVLLHLPVCFEACQNKDRRRCQNRTELVMSGISCNLKFINFTLNSPGMQKNIRIWPQSPYQPNDCNCDLKYNYRYDGYCVWKPLLKNFLNYNAFWKKGSMYADLKFIAFFCQSLQDMIACNHLANLCIQSFFDTDKNSPCSVFLLAQASDAAQYSNVGEKLDGLRPFLFYKKGKETVQEMEEQFDIPLSSDIDNAFELFSIAYSLDGHLMKWEKLRPNIINFCGHGLKEIEDYFKNFESFHIKCELTMESIIDLVSANANGQFFSVFLNHMREDNKRYLQTIPVLIKNAFEGNEDSNIGEWQLVKRFQVIGADTTNTLIGQKMLPFEDSFKLRLFKSIRVMSKFELRCTLTKEQTILTPLIELDFHKIDLSLNTSLSESFDFELTIKFDQDNASGPVFKIIVIVSIVTSILFAVLRTYAFKRRRNLEWADALVCLEFLLHLISNIGNSFLVFVFSDTCRLIFSYVMKPNVTLTLFQNTYNFQLLIFFGIGLKGIYFFFYFWRIAHVDVFFVDWERPKSCDNFMHFKNNLETSSQCSSIRTISENNVSAWRIFFLANEWIELSSKQNISPFVQGFFSLSVYWVMTSFFSSYNFYSASKVFICLVIFSTVHTIQRLYKKLVLERVNGGPLKKFIDICSLANISILALYDCSFGYYIHGRSPHGFSDTDMSSMILQLQRESRNMCGRRGLLSDSDFQAYIVLPPLNFKKHIEQLFPLQQRPDNLSHSHFQKDLGSGSTNMNGLLERSTTSYNKLNRFFCAFIDHAIKDMDYIIKEKTFAELLLNCEFESFVAENKGTLYIDNRLAVCSLHLYGNQNDIFVMELLLLLTIFFLTNSFTISVVIVCSSNKLFQYLFRMWAKNNISSKTLIDKRFLM